MDIIVTTPKKNSVNAALEAAWVIKQGGGYYFRRLPYEPWKLKVGDRIFYVDHDYVRGYAIVDEIIVSHEPFVCEATGYEFKPGCYVRMRADSWKWIEPILMRGFQGFRYYIPPDNMQVIGGWLTPYPVREWEIENAFA